MKKLFALLFVIIFALALFGGEKPGKTLAGSESHTLSGFAWGADATTTTSVESGGLGWLSFNCDNVDDCGDSDYSVTLNADDTLTGNAWSSNFGWVQFGGLSGFPSGTGTTASNAKMVAGKLVGWARVCSGTVTGDCSGATRADGWDGWVSLSGTTGKSHAYGITLNSQNIMEGYAWGGAGIGWVNFAPGYDPDEPSDGPGGCEENDSCVSFDLPVSCVAKKNGNTVTEVNAGDMITWVASASGGSGTYTYTWSDEATGDKAVSDAVSYDVEGDHSATIDVTSGDASGSADCKVTVNAVPVQSLTVSCVPDKTVAIVNKTPVRWSTVVSGGVEPHIYNWDTDNSSGENFETTYGEIGFKTEALTVTDSSPTAQSAVCATPTKYVNVVPDGCLLPNNTPVQASATNYKYYSVQSAPSRSECESSAVIQQCTFSSEGFSWSQSSNRNFNPVNGKIYKYPTCIPKGSFGEF